MRRRDFLSLLSGAAAARPLIAEVQSADPPLFGMLLVVPPGAGKAFTEPMRAFLQALGYVEGRTIAFDFCFADGQVERLPSLAADLVARRPAIIVTFGDATARATQAATSTIPIVSMSEDLVRARLVLNLARPEGNTTGVSIMAPSSTPSGWSSSPSCCPRAAPSCSSPTPPRIESPGRPSTPSPRLRRSPSRRRP